MALFSIHSSLPFLETAVKALMSGTLLSELNSPASFRKATVFVPSLHAAQLCARLLSVHDYPQPKIIALGHLPDHFESVDLPHVLSPQKFQLWVAKKIQKRMIETEKSLSFSAAYSLSHKLLQFFDALTLNHIPVEHIHSVREKMPQDISGFLSVMFHVLADIPLFLEDQGAITNLQRAKIQMDRYEERLRLCGSPHAVVILGSTGSQMSTHLLMKRVSSLPNGLVILPGMDYETPESSWLSYSAHPTHPQMLLSRFVQSCRQSRKQVIPLHHCTPSTSGLARFSLLTQALATSEEISSWAEPTPDRTRIYTTALEGLAIEIAENERHEAARIAVALHKAYIKGAQRPTLITPDRVLADYTFQELQRWPHPVFMTAPSSLSSTLAGRLTLLSLRLFSSPLSPTAISAFLAHPWVTLGLDLTIYKICRPLLDTLFLRHFSLKGNMEFLVTRLQTFTDPTGYDSLFCSLPEGSHQTYSTLSPALKEALSEGIHTLVTAYTSWLKEQNSRTLGSFIKHHLALLEALTRKENSRGIHTYLDAKPLLDLLETHTDSDMLLSLEDYKTLLEAIIKDTHILPEQREPQGPCIQISGLWEARFLTPDYVVLGGLSETVWPPSPSTDAVFGRALTQTLGLPSPETRIGQSAHDFIQLLCRTPNALITYSRKRNNTPILPSRFLLRLQACLGDALWARVHTQIEPLKPGEESPQLPPYQQSLECKGHSSLSHHLTLSIPKTISVKALENLISDPQRFFIRHILDIKPTSDRLLTLGSGTYSTLIHHILGRFTQAYPTHMPPNPLDTLLSLGAETFDHLKHHDHRVGVLWWTKFQHVAAAFIVWEEKRRPSLERVSSSVPGRVVLTTHAGPLTLTTSTDRLEKRHDGSYVLIDFKTSTLPSHREVHTGLALSLILQAASLEDGKLDSVPHTSPYHLTYVQTASGTRGFEERTLYPSKEISSLSAFVALIRAQLEEKINDYISRPDVLFT